QVRGGARDVPLARRRHRGLHRLAEGAAPDALMAWFRRSSDDTTPPPRKVVIAEGLWVKCDSCKEIVYRQEIERAGRVCPKCRYAFRISARDRIGLLTDRGSF